jgi:uncharacterized membrane protein YidH (DUF202 family)
MHTTNEHTGINGLTRFRGLTENKVVSEDALLAAEQTARTRGVDLETVLIREYGVPRRTLLETLSAHYGLPVVEYDERLPIPPELFSRLDAEQACGSPWFPLFKDKDRVIIAVNDPDDCFVQKQIKQAFPDSACSFRVALLEDIRWFIQDFMKTTSGHLVGTERTGLAYWRNTMAHWRTRLACYRTDLAKGRTGLNIMRWGLGLITLADALMRTHKHGEDSIVYWSVLAAGLCVSIAGLSGYLKVRSSRMSPPRDQTLVEVTGAVLTFLEDYHFMENDISTPTKKTMLGRLGDLLSSYSTFLTPFPAYRERINLARERNVLAAQRTVASCYRTIASRARTGLSFLRTGVAMSSLGIGLIRYFGFSPLTVFDALLVVAGLLMIMDGMLWYWPVRKEQADTPRSYVQSQI